MQSLLRNTKAKQKILRRLEFVPRHITLLSALLFVLSLLLFLSWPLQTNRTYFSENALMPGSAHMAYSNQQLTYARSVWSTMRSALQRQRDGDSDALLHTVTAELRRLGCEIMDWHVVVNDDDDHRRRSRVREDEAEVITVQYVHGVLRAPRGNGKESIMLSAVIDLDGEKVMEENEFGGSSLDNAALLLSLAHHFSKVRWQGHDLSFTVFIVNHHHRSTDNAPGSQFRKQRILERMIQDRVLLNQFSLIREAIVLDFSDYSFEQVVLQAEGVNGEMANLDMVNVMVALCNVEGLWVSLFDKPTEQFTSALAGLDTVFESQQQQQHRRHSARGASWYREISHYKREDHDYPFEIVHLARSWWNQLLGIPTGLHGFFRSNYNIHAITMKDAVRQGKRSSGNSRSDLAQRMRHMVSVARVVEGTVRSMNNLIESLHHSFFIYFLASPVKYHGFEDFLPNLWLFVAPLVLQGFILYYTSSKMHIGHSTIMFVLSLATGFVIYIVPKMVDNVLSLLGKMFKVYDHHLVHSSQAFILAWFMVVMSLVVMLFKFAYPQVADSLYRQWITGIKSRHAAVAVHEDEHRASVLDWKSLKSLVLLFIGAIIGVMTVTDSALSVLLAAYLSLLSIVVGKLDRTEHSLTRLMRCLIMFTLSPIALLLVVLAVTTVFHSHVDTTHGAAGQNHENTVEWASLVDLFFSGTRHSHSHDWLMSNSLYFYLCILCVPAYLVFLKLSLEHMKQARNGGNKMNFPS